LGDRQPYHPGKLNYIPVMIIALAVRTHDARLRLEQIERLLAPDAAVTALWPFVFSVSSGPSDPARDRERAELKGR
jgi:hypothetical protein